MKGIRIQDEIRMKIKSDILDGINNETIAKKHGISISFVKKLRAEIKYERPQILKPCNKFTYKLLSEWDEMKYIADLLKRGEAKIVDTEGKKRSVMRDGSCIKLPQNLQEAAVRREMNA